MEEIFEKIAELMLAMSKASIELADTKQRAIQMNDGWIECIKNYNSLQEKYDLLQEKYDLLKDK